MGRNEMGNLAIYPGTFDPVTNGHLDIIQRGAEIFDRIIVAVAASRNKNPLFSLEERVEMLKKTAAGYKGVSVEPFDGLLVDYARSKGARVIIRGLRAVSDFEYEFQLALMNRKLNPGMDTFFVMPSEKYVYLNSGLIKEISRMGGDISSLVPDEVLNNLKAKYHK
ncbi:MAG: pantetheine-phosphate adenylyltransferase [Candidatus Edwardsbacteria bacterium RIFOXYD12_FULL_50_11]|jgi:pantetheine-phosphate adenylyltransferase|uniref:Phosphopantetheine adenylyltransferase n=1 Tax=Candidatus Edwardsbacteria bacterium GWF2_54_11 TaxID=1817851 RepID=A0A1F5RFX0_9BACT|nr:MAG: pantetheine-phosphate adenylyltransferase [Candidatus Edwardsbacteria bacterium RifOxyC12_full_54_24]OGF08521.1 MAG: pantetheine-phosphate adenylyltransferase [Candidatus Edwardsbacteria bacterium RifOxyA12_full_54_48]OGF11415.1 MAG: pantetheine-phosphate adenylyltransferase [Candidatus Edwardsbacteria bacterium GWE2_54_12]OGF13350.1 MAG: pantetheine-phosphate adenylyltransferase [Candidatus Edwardsbacteria bacterium GWF2_54_11]OGF16391.1 MAG: pantetheine-phosphate adenylyltransferase [